MGIVRDAVTNSISVFNILESLAAQQFPTALPQFQLLSLIERDPEIDPDEYDVKGTISLNGKQLPQEISMRVSFEKKRRNRLIVTFGGIPIEEPGLLEFSLDYEGQLKTTYSLEIAEAEDPSSEARD